MDAGSIFVGFSLLCIAALTLHHVRDLEKAKFYKSQHPHSPIHHHDSLSGVVLKYSPVLLLANSLLKWQLGGRARLAEC